ncbi:MAG: NosD domain-containing protein, partial [Candidatus Heimdallarchaeaceae archaeon]
TKAIYISQIADGTAKIINNTCIIKDLFHSCGISLSYCSGIEVTNNTCVDESSSEIKESTGIELYFAKNITIENNYCFNVRDGILLEDPINIKVVNNSCLNNQGIGIYISYAVSDEQGALIENNVCNQNHIGIGVFNCNNVTIVNNTCNNNNKYGIKLHNSWGSKILANILNANGIDLFQEGDDGTTYEVQDNVINGKPFGYFAKETGIIIDDQIKYGQLLFIACVDITISSQQIMNTSTGITFYYSSDFTVSDVICSNNLVHGIYIYASNNGEVSNSRFEHNNYDGILTEDSKYISLVSNTLNNNDQLGVEIQFSLNIEVLNNVFTSNGFDINNYKLSDYTSCSVSGNTINSKPLGYFVGQKGVAVTSSNYGELIFLFCEDITVTNVIISDCSWSVILRDCKNAIIVSNTFENNKIGAIYCKDTSNLTIIENTILFNDQYGIYLFGCLNPKVNFNNIYQNSECGLYFFYCDVSEILGNTVVQNDGKGIHLQYTAYATLEDNNCSNNLYGLSLVGSYSSTLSNNFCCNNSYYGVFLWHSSGSTIKNNTCNFNEYGLYLATSTFVINNTFSNNYYGIYIDQTSRSTITYNTIAHSTSYGIYIYYKVTNNTIWLNNFIDNNLGGTSQAFSYTPENMFYNSTTKEGNYWSDWSGIGAYEIDTAEGDLVDLYPLTEPVEYPIEPEPTTSTVSTETGKTKTSGDPLVITILCSLSVMVILSKKKKKH